MIYNNIILFMVALLLMTIAKAPASPLLPTSWSLLQLPLFMFLYWLLAGQVFARFRHKGSSGYFSTELLLSYMALFFFLISLHLFSIKYYLSPLTFDGKLPFMEDLGSLLLFLSYLSLMWLQAKPHYQRVFRRSLSNTRFIISNIKINLPLLFPWFFLTVTFDFLRLLPFPDFQAFLLSIWGDLFTYGLFVVFVIIFFPPLIKRFWNCRPLPEGPERERIISFCRKHGFKSEVLLWPLFEGKALTAGIIGLIPKFRYMMLTPGLLATMNEEEIDSILAHELAHVKRKHLLLYLSLFISFSIAIGAGSMFINGIILNADSFYTLIDWLAIDPEIIRDSLYALFIIVTFLIFIRYIFGFFMRNFERQADIHVFEAIGSCFPLISAFEKIALLSGNIRNEKNWHHYGIGERVDFLAACQRRPQLVEVHNKSLRKYLIIYFLVIALCTAVLSSMDSKALLEKNYMRYMKRVAIHKIGQPIDKVDFLTIYAAFFLKNSQEAKALELYQEALLHAPKNHLILNNIAWLLTTAKDNSIRDPKQGLLLAQKAADLKQEGFILDTLARAFMENDMFDQAVGTEQKAMELDPTNKKYYSSQIAFFRAKKNGEVATPPSVPFYERSIRNTK